MAGHEGWNSYSFCCLHRHRVRLQAAVVELLQSAWLLYCPSSATAAGSAVIENVVVATAASNSRHLPLRIPVRAAITYVTTQYYFRSSDITIKEAAAIIDGC